MRPIALCVIAVLMAACGGSGGNGSGDQLLGQFDVQESRLFSGLLTEVRVCFVATTCLGASDSSTQAPMIGVINASTQTGRQTPVDSGAGFDGLALALTDGLPSPFVLLIANLGPFECTEYTQFDLTSFVDIGASGNDFAGFQITRVVLEIDSASIAPEGGTNTRVILQGHVLIFGTKDV